MTIEKLFVTQIYRVELIRPGEVLNADLKQACLGIAEEDRAGQAWCRANGYRGYTSYASLTDLPRRASVFQDLVDRIDSHVGRLARSVDMDLGTRALVLDSLWINVLEPGGHHAGHIHPHSAVSGTYYVEVPRGASAIRFEDPRLPRMMAAPPRKSDARPPNRTFVAMAPKAGTLLLWESWLSHEVPANGAAKPRISISFNYRWE
jgi:uncharacterized protein (TIGR02466 family)